MVRSKFKKTNEIKTDCLRLHKFTDFRCTHRCKYLQFLIHSLLVQGSWDNHFTHCVDVDSEPDDIEFLVNEIILNTLELHAI